MKYRKIKRKLLAISTGIFVIAATSSVALAATVRPSSINLNPLTNAKASGHGVKGSNNQSGDQYHSNGGKKGQQWDLRKFDWHHQQHSSSPS